MAETIPEIIAATLKVRQHINKLSDVEIRCAAHTIGFDVPDGLSPEEKINALVARVTAFERERNGQFRLKAMG